MSNLSWNTSLKSRLIKYSLWKRFFQRSLATWKHLSGLANIWRTSGLRIWHTVKKIWKMWNHEKMIIEGIESRVFGVQKWQTPFWKGFWILSKCGWNHLREFDFCTMLQKLSKCEVKEAKCGNFTICLPFRFYVKSNSGEFKR